MRLHLFGNEIERPGQRPVSFIFVVRSQSTIASHIRIQNGSELACERVFHGATTFLLGVSRLMLSRRLVGGEETSALSEATVSNFPVVK